MNVLDVLIDQVKEAHLDGIIDDGKEKQDNEDDVRSIAKVFDRLRDELLIDGQSENVEIPLSSCLLGRHRAYTIGLLLDLALRSVALGSRGICLVI